MLADLFHSNGSTYHNMHFMFPQIFLFVWYLSKNPSTLKATSHHCWCNIWHCNSAGSQNQLFDTVNIDITYSCWLNMNTIGSRLLYSHHNTCTNHRHLTVRVASPCCAFNLWRRISAGFTLSFTRSLMITALFYTKSNKVWWHHLVLTLMHRSTAHGHLPGSECSVTTNCPLKSFIFLMPISSGKKKWSPG
jgi:hypothetical protein